MFGPLDEPYFEWLCEQVGTHNDNPSRTYWTALRQLFTKEFVWIVPNDDNRIEDGRDLRHEFADSLRIRNVDPEWMQLGCSVLELLVSLSRRLSFEAEGEPRDWFWHMFRNLGVDNYPDGRSYNEDAINDILERFIWRTYESSGQGGIFPLRDPPSDQRGVEIWYQLNYYIQENDTWLRV